MHGSVDGGFDGVGAACVGSDEESELLSFAGDIAFVAVGARAVFLAG